jgi:PAS domain S-box-containing protein
MQHDGESTTTRASLELLFEISRELTAALELSTVLQRVLSLSMGNVGAITGSLIVLDSSGDPVEGIISVGNRVIENATKQLSETLNDGLAGWVIRHQQGVLIADTSQDERWLRRPDDDEGQTGAKSAVSVPLIVHQQLIGVMTLVHPSPNIFLSAHLELIQAIADQAGIAVLNARLFEESQRRARVMTALAESASVITASLDLDEVLQRILPQISEALQVETVSLALIDSTGDALTFVASSTGIEDDLIGYQTKLGEGFAGQVAQSGIGEVITDTTKDDRFSLDFECKIEADIRAIICAPLISQGEVIGILEAINPTEGKFEPDALEVLTGIGSLAGTAINHARLYEQVQTTQKRYHDLFQDSIDPILISDRHGKVLEANRQAEIFTGFDKGSLLTKLINQLLTSEQEIPGLGSDDLTPGEIRSIEAELITSQGSQIPIRLYVRSVDVEKGVNSQWLIRDISERRKLDRLREDLISMIYHDLRSPLANIVSSLDVFNAMLPHDGDPAYRSLLNIALRSTERIQRLTNSLLDISRLETGQPVINLFSTSPVLLAVDAVEAVSPVAESKNQIINIKIPAQTPPVTVDADMIRRVLINLLENAVKYSPPEGEISLGAEVKSEHVDIWVQDSGPGIPAEEQDHIFDKFTRLNPKGSQKGFGLGLAYCRLAIEGHRGKIWVESEPGKGSRFCFTLPLDNE